MCEIKVKNSSGLANTIKWWKVECSFFKESFGVAHWSDLVEFMDHNIGFDYKITGMRSEIITGVAALYDRDNGFTILKNKNNE